MDKIISTPEAEAAFEKIGNAIKGAEASRMFGMPCYKVKGKAFFGLYNNDVVFKLTGDPHKEALALKGAKLFDPSGMNRPMKQWVQVPPAHKSKFAAFATEAFNYVKKETK
ncbi:MAG TPA: hypothetical protein VEW28_00300 [Candidatus Kapabacteria bacterium]|nr:hypothetical protein [Candidatus Kapabacteria bacterium]